MSERKVLNKYYPPDFDPSKIPKLKQQKNKQYTIRTMAPFNMRCNTCADYIYKGRKFNAKCEVAEGENFLGLRIFRFYIRCPKCITEIMFKTDPENTDYTLESGATRLFEAAKLIEEAERREQKQREEDATNPMKMLETRTKDSKLEMDIIENLEDLREINTRKEEVDYTEVLRKKAEEEQERLLRQEREDEEEIKRIFGRTSEGSLKRLKDDPEDDDEAEFSPSVRKHLKASDVLVEGNSTKMKSSQSNRKKISSMIKRKQTVHLEPSNDEASPSGVHAPETTPSESVRPIADQGRATSSQITSRSLDKDHGIILEAAKKASAVSGDSHKETKTMPGLSNGMIEESSELPEQSSLFDSIKEGMTKKVEQAEKKETEKLSSFGLLVGYDGSDSDSSSGNE